MKKLLGTFIITIAFCACSGTSSNKEAILNDSISVDTTLVDTMDVDSVDSVLAL